MKPSTAARELTDVYPLTPMQHGMLIESLASQEPVYLQVFHLEVAGADDASVLRSALAQLIARHDVLRAGIVWDVGDRPLHVVCGSVAPRLTVEDLSQADDDAVAERVGELFEQDCRTPLDLRVPPLMRVRAVRARNRRWHLIMTYHHLVVDGWSVPLLHAELAELISAAVDGRAPELASPHRFSQFVAWQAAEADPEGDRRYFSEVLAGLTAATPLGHGIPDRRSWPAADPATGRVVVSRQLPAHCQPGRAAARFKVLPSTIVNAAWALVLGRWAQVPDVTFGMVVSGRPPELPDVSGRIGMFVNTAVLRIPVPLEARLGDWLAQVRERISQAQLRSQAPLSLALERSAIAPGAPLLSSVLAFQNYWRAEADDVQAGGVAVRLRRRTERVDMPISAGVALPDDGLWIRMDYDTARLTGAEANRTAQRLAGLIETFGSASGAERLGDLPLDQPPVVLTRRAPSRTGPAAVRSLIAMIANRCLAGDQADQALTDSGEVITARELWHWAAGHAAELAGP